MSIDNLPANISDMDAATLMRMSGQTMSGQDGIGLPSLRVNYDDEDADKNKIPRGSWTVYADDGQVFADSVLFQPLLTTVQYNHYDAEEQKTRATSIHATGFDNEFPDSAGGFKCGKVSKKQFADLSEAEQKVQKAIKCSKVFFGLVTVEGVDSKGEEKKVVDLPCIFYARGTHFMPMADYIAELEKTKVPMQTTQVLLNLNRQKNGGVTYWEVHPTTAATGLSLGEEVNGVYGAFVETVQAENSDIQAKWIKAREKLGTKSMKDIAADADGRSVDDIIEGQSADLDTEIPF